MNRQLFILVFSSFLFFGCSENRKGFVNIKQTFSNKTLDLVSNVGEKTKEYANKSIDFVKDTATDSLKKIDIVTQFIYSQPELNIVDDSISEQHIFSYKKDLYLTINMLPNTRFIESAKEFVKLSDKAISVEVSVKLPKTFNAISTGGLVSEVKNDKDTTVFFVNINNTKNKLYSLILKISGKSDGEVFINVAYRDDEYKEKGICENYQQKILFKR